VVEAVEVNRAAVVAVAKNFAARTDSNARQISAEQTLGAAKDLLTVDFDEVASAVNFLTVTASRAMLGVSNNVFDVGHNASVIGDGSTKDKLLSGRELCGVLCFHYAINLRQPLVFVKGKIHLFFIFFLAPVTP